MPIETAKATSAATSPTHRAASSVIERHSISTGRPTSGATITSVSQGIVSI